MTINSDTLALMHGLTFLTGAIAVLYLLVFYQPKKSNKDDEDPPMFV